jgi:small subunit ribosomal protein S17
MTDKKVQTSPVGEDKKVIRKRFQGVVVSDAMDKTIVVRVDRVKVHPKYLKRFTVSRKYKVHDEKNQYKEGDKVSFVECRPMSKDKRWRVENDK